MKYFNNSNLTQFKSKSLDTEGLSTSDAIFSHLASVYKSVDLLMEETLCLFYIMTRTFDCIAHSKS